MRRFRTCAMVVLCCAFPAACLPDTDVIPDQAMRRDSAGITILEYGGELPATPVALETLWTHGHGPDHYTFQFAFLGGLLDDGAALVADVANSEVVMIGASGADHEVVAPAGEGPTEVRGPRSVARASDHGFWVQDGGNARLLLYEGGVLSRTVSTAGDRELTFGLRPLAAARDGRLLMTTASYRSDFEQDWLDGHMVTVDPETRSLDTVGAYPKASRRPESGINPFQGSGVIAGAGSGYVHARMDRPEVIWRTADGDVVRILRWRPEPTYPDQAMFDAFIAFLREDLVRVNPGMSAEQVRQFVDERAAAYELDTSEPLPLFGQMHGGADSSVWLAAPNSGTPLPSRYIVISADGEWVGMADFGRPFLVLDVTADRVLGMVTDEFDVQAVRVYRYALSP